MNHPALSIVAQLDVPTAVDNHRFVHEALANAMLLESKQDVRTQVVGTENTRQCELYGWAPNVDSHRDNTGWMYAVMLNEGESWVHSWATPEDTCCKLLSVQIRRGSVFRLWDFVEHWTEDRGPRIAAFVGSFEHPADETALSVLTKGIARLAAGDYYGAPRVRESFRALQPDECLVHDFDHDVLATMLLADAQRDGHLIETCAKCEKPAVRPDAHWPYHHDQSRCREHLGKEI